MIKKIYKRIIIISCFFIMISFLNKVFGVDSTSNPLYIGSYSRGQEKRAGYYDYIDKNGGRINLNKMVKYSNSQMYGTGDKYTRIYSLKNGTSEINPNYALPYTQYFDLKNMDEIQQIYKESIDIANGPTANYNKIIWILNKMADVENSESIKRLLSNAGISNEDFLGNKSKMSYETQQDIIESIQQMAIWYFANTDQYNPGNDINIRVGNDSINKNSVTEIYYRDKNNNPIKKLYKYFIDGANNAVNSGFKYTNLKDNSENISFDTGRITTNIVGENIFVGPYKINSNGINEFKINFKNQTEVLTNLRIFNQNEEEIRGNNIEEKIKKVLNNDFYIVFPKNTSVKELYVEVSAVYEKTDMIFWSTSPSIMRRNQPIVVLNKIKVEYFNNKSVQIVQNEPKFDLALRKFAYLVIDSKGNQKNIGNRAPNISKENIKKLALRRTNIDNGTTVEKNQIKSPIEVEKGDLITYKIRVYNEGNINGFAKQITEYIPEGAEFVSTEQSEINKRYGWKQEDHRTAKTDILKDIQINAFNETPENGLYTLNFVEIEIQIKIVSEVNSVDNFMKSITEITSIADRNNQSVTDRDSSPKNLTNDQIKNYNTGNSEKGKGEEDDDDYENLLLKGRNFDLALRTFVVNVNDKVINDREPTTDVTKLLNQQETTTNYNHTKKPVTVSIGDIVTYRIRVYNEGTIDGYADEIVQYLPPELEFLNNDFNAKNGWKIDKNDLTQRTIRTENLSSEKDQENKILAFTGGKINYKEVELQCKIKPNTEQLKQITTLVELSRSSNKSNIVDRDNKKNLVRPSDDSLQNYIGNSENKKNLDDKDYFYKGFEDDDDFEKVILQKFDLALRKFITNINDVEIKNRVPVVDSSKYGKLDDQNKEITTMTYTHTKEPIRIFNNDVVIFTIRIYNEGTQNGYAKEIKTDLGSGLEYLPTHPINVKYKWSTLDAAGNTTYDLNFAKYGVTTYLSKESSEDNLIKLFDSKTMNEPEYKEVKIAFKINEFNPLERIVYSNAYIGVDTNESGEDVNDNDSTPNKWNDNEDDQDFEKLYVKYLDLQLNSELNSIILIEDGIQKEMKIGKGIGKKEPLKIELNKKELENTVIKVKYNINVKNIGEVPAYVNEIIDYIPKGLRFNKADNQKWNENDGNIITEQMKGKLIAPKSEEKIDIILTWVNDSDNLKTFKNLVEIKNYSSDYNSTDINSVPNNKVENENDIDYVNVEIKTKEKLQITVVIIIIIVVIAIIAGIVIIRKFIL